jgi:signal transduction histidine kinase/CheY-like chemotaxis protein
LGSSRGKAPPRRPARGSGTKKRARPRPAAPHSAACAREIARLKRELAEARRDHATWLAREKAARARAEENDRIRDEFVATLAHELRGPLNAMVGWVHILRAAGIDEATRERGRAAIERGVKAQTRLIEDLLDYSRMATRKLRLARRLTDVGAVAEAAVEAARSMAAAKEIRLALARQSPMPMVLSDPDRLQQVAWNLVSNAVKFTPRGGRVEVWVGRVDASLHLRVSDTGQGITRDFLPQVFERFRQGAGGPGRSQGGGLGLGLAIVKLMVELHGGTVEADSAGEGQGATFTVALPIPPLLLPLADAGQAEAAVESTAAEKAGTQLHRNVLEGIRLLVVEDEADSREMLVAAFEQCGAQVSVAASAGEAMEVLQRVTPGAIVCDIVVPGVDGHELIRKVRAVEAEGGGRIPALALTAHGGPEDREKALAAGFDTYVAKPAAPAELVAKVALLAGGGRK